MRIPVLIAVAALSIAGVASAKVIGGAEARSIFFGLDMGGVYEPDGAPWRECIAPSGQTHYWYDGDNFIGKLNVRDDGALCFAYDYTDFKKFSCFTAEREGKGWRFVSVTDPAVVFLAKRATKTKVCTDNAPNA
jgi:hypothetical protein